MTPKIVFVLLPLLVYCAWLGVAAARGRLPARQSVNVHTSLLLMTYLLTTASLGIFWVANQQLPAFDWHYLFGYCTVLLVSVHLFFNLPLAWRLWRGPARTSAPAAGYLAAGKALLIAALLGAAFFLGTRERANDELLRSVDAQMSSRGGLAVDAVVRFHEFSSASRRSVLTNAPGVEWGTPPPPFKSYPDARHIRLAHGGVGTPALSASLRGPRVRGARLRLAELGDILFLAAGVTARRGGNALRAAPSSGALFSSELYVLARAVDGLPSGVYHYDPDLQRLDVIGELLPAATGAPDAGDADAAIVATSVFRRTGYKYRDRAYRYVTADTGHLLENLRVAAHAAGMHPQLLPKFDERRLASTIGVDGVEEGVLAVMALRHTGGASERSAAPRFVGIPFGVGTVLGATSMAQDATSLRLAADTVAPGLIALPPPQMATMPVRLAITERRSQRRFHADPVPLAALSGILADMVQAPQLSEAVRIHIVVNRVDGLAPGVYRYLGQRHALERVRGGDQAVAAQSAALSQEVIGGAAVVLVLSAERDPMLAEGARGYRHGFLEAGMIGERWLLGAVARGLAACPVGAFYDGEAAALIGVDRQRQWVLHLAALGLPAERVTR